MRSQEFAVRDENLELSSLVCPEFTGPPIQGSLCTNTKKIIDERKLILCFPYQDERKLIYLFVIVFVLAVIYLEYIMNSIGVPAG